MRGSEEEEGVEETSLLNVMRLKGDVPAPKVDT